MLTENGTRDVVIHQIQEILLDDGDENTGSIRGSDELVALGLNSLMLTRLILLLSAHFGIDPFADERASIADTRTVDQLVAAYEAARTTLGQLA
ncbi:phosphopantetheine-binding protein [Streptomyces sp. CA-132043]|uniref:phosphopantetheine-binding protein n=1 Tax=Streptomyces sp. CA-132043 TaxID=3240048 RepID=UPI003D8F04EE